MFTVDCFPFVRLLIACWFCLHDVDPYRTSFTQANPCSSWMDNSADPLLVQRCSVTDPVLFLLYWPDIDNVLTPNDSTWTLTICWLRVDSVVSETWTSLDPRWPYIDTTDASVMFRPCCHSCFNSVLRLKRHLYVLSSYCPWLAPPWLQV